MKLIPARVRGQVDLVINSTYWAGAMLGALGTYVVLNPNLVPAEWGWRLSFILGGFLGLLILLFRHWVPESPRWLATHGRGREAEEIVESVEREVTADPTSLSPLDGRKQRLCIREYTPLVRNLARDCASVPNPFHPRIYAYGHASVSL